MRLGGNKRFKIIVTVVVGLLLVVIGVAAAPSVKDWLTSAHNSPASPDDQNNDGSPQLVCLDPPTLKVEADVVKRLHVEATRVRKVTEPTPLEMHGQFAPNIDRLFHVKLRFAGTVEEIGKTADRDQNGQTIFRDLRVGDRVQKGDVLAVLYSSDLGQKKSDFVDALSQLQLDEEVLKNYEKPDVINSLPERTVMNQRRLVDQDCIQANRAENILRAGDVSEEELETLREEVKQVRSPGKNSEKWKQWAHLVIKSPGDGSIVERNVTVGEVMDPSTSPPPLFQVMNRGQITVWAFAYDDDLPKLQNLRRPIHWTVRMPADPAAKPLTGTIDNIGAFIDPNQHSAVITGLVSDEDGRLVAGEFVNATVELPPAPNLVEIPTTALVEDGHESIVFIQPDSQQPIYTLRHVEVVRRGTDKVYIRWLWPDLLAMLSTWPMPGSPIPLAMEAVYQGSQNQIPNPLRSILKPEEEYVVTNGALELREALKEEQDKVKQPES